MKLDRKKIIPVMWLILGALIVEIVLCNFSAWKSLTYPDKIVFDYMKVVGGERIDDKSMEYVVPKGMLSVRIAGVDRKIQNLFFDMGFSQKEVIPYTVSLVDEGNYYPYSLPEQYMVPGVERSLYTNIYPSGKVSEIILQFTLPEGSIVRIDEISANAPIPLIFNLGRFMIVLGGVLFAYFIKHYLLKEWKEKEQLIITGVVVLALIVMSWMLVHVNPTCVASPWPHHKQYHELAEAMSRGQVNLEAQPSEKLMEVENPYDTIYLQANGIHYQADYAYYNGGYYVYFGIVPELLLYLPCYLLTGYHLPNYMAVFIFYCGFIFSVFALYREVVKRWFSKTPFVIYLLISGLTVLSGNYLFVIARPDLYDTPIMAATMFTVMGLWLWIKGKYSSGVWKRVCFLLGSLCLSLVAGCRPQMLLFSILAIPLFWEEVIRKRTLFSKTSLWDSLCISVPYIIVAAGIMYYNAVRFGSPFDFGATYSLTSNDMTKRSFNLPQMFLGIWHYFFRPPIITSDFPFLQGSQIRSLSYMGKLNSEYTYGGILACNVFTWSVLFVGKCKTALKQKGVYALVLSSIAISIILGIVDVTGAGILQRYMVDMIWGIWFAASIVMLVLVEKTQHTKYFSQVINVLLVIVLLQIIYGFGIVLGNGDLSISVKISNPELYYRIQHLFIF